MRDAPRIGSLGATELETRLSANDRFREVPLSLVGRKPPFSRRAGLLCARRQAWRKVDGVASRAPDRADWRAAAA